MRRVTGQKERSPGYNGGIPLSNQELGHLELNHLEKFVRIELVITTLLQGWFSPHPDHTVPPPTSNGQLLTRVIFEQDKTKSRQLVEHQKGRSTGAESGSNFGMPAMYGVLQRTKSLFP
jgi:hypothetical protein